MPGRDETEIGLSPPVGIVGEPFPAGCGVGPPPVGCAAPEFGMPGRDETGSGYRRLSASWENHFRPAVALDHRRLAAPRPSLEYPEGMKPGSGYRRLSASWENHFRPVVALDHRRLAAPRPSLEYPARMKPGSVSLRQVIPFVANRHHPSLAWRLCCRRQSVFCRLLMDWSDYLFSWQALLFANRGKYLMILLYVPNAKYGIFLAI